eukprot:6854005-Lingulodinium_polyedra.AAC.1
MKVSEFLEWSCDRNAVCGHDITNVDLKQGTVDRSSHVGVYALAEASAEDVEEGSGQMSILHRDSEQA